MKIQATLKEAKEHLRQNWDKGTGCPCCGQLVKLYKRKLNSGMAITLFRIYQYNGFNPVHVKDFLKDNKLRNNHDWTLLKHWGLLKEEYNEDEDKKHSGVYHLTQRGVYFLTTKLTLPKHILIYNNKFQGFSHNLTTFI